MDDLTITASGMKVSGWEEVRVTRGIERVPSDFQISLTERYPGEVAKLVLHPGDPCQMRIGDDLVLTGYIDRYMPSYDAKSHRVTLSGRSKCGDLVDCSAEWPSFQIAGDSTLGIAQKLAKPYGIEVKSLAGSGRDLPQFNLNIGETPMEIIERICRFSALLAYDQPDGSLLFAQAGTRAAASGFQEGKNVQSAMVSFSQDNRFSEYRVLMQSMTVTGDIGNAGDTIWVAKDSGVLRNRQRLIIAEASDGGMLLAQDRANWECVRRYGRSAQVYLRTDGWRDSAGKLWEPNTLVNVDLPSLHCERKHWLIAEVSYVRNDQGTTAELLIMPPEAFIPEPKLLQPITPDIPANAINGPQQ